MPHWLVSVSHLLILYHAPAWASAHLLEVVSFLCLEHVLPGEVLPLFWNHVRVLAFSHDLHFFCVNCLMLYSPLVCFEFFIMSNSLDSCIMASTAFCDLWASTLFTQAKTCSLVSSLIFSIVVTSLIISDVIVLLFMTLINSSYIHLWC